MRLIYVTCKNFAEAKKIAEALVKEKLVACANIIPRVNSLFLWDKKIENCTESLLLMKTTLPYSQIKKRIEQLHSYKIPLIASFKIAEINECYKNWAENIQEK